MDKPLCGNNRAPAGWILQEGSGRSFKAELRTSFTVKECSVGARRVSSFPFSPMCSFVHSQLSSPPPPSTGPFRCTDSLLLLMLLQRLLETWQRCCNNSTSSPTVTSSGTLTVPSVRLVRRKTAVLFASNEVGT